MKKIIKKLVIASMKIALWRMKLRLFLYTTRRSIKNVFRKKDLEINCHQQKNTIKLVNAEVDEI